MDKSQETKLLLRAAIAERHCLERGWPTDLEKLTREQVLEIRNLPQWISPIITKRARNRNWVEFESDIKDFFKWWYKTKMQQTTPPEIDYIVKQYIDYLKNK